MTFFEFFDGGVVVLRVLWRYLAEESWVDDVLRRRGSSAERFFAGGVFGSAAWGMDLCERDGSEGRTRENWGFRFF
ncbi:wall-associated receptor kinase 2-like [Cucumis melo var. makuwa]|uniref:Wall-associated receptor kinase 2-like n=1 Tax=Cucumis melo var. makuwa TaxID=1194695 RepID=A0A5D3DME3_CUCMM|nr:wall-associated receptor kinase 2-like [Cucumis melo var. makuwa]TYK24797.1 wall-associated receptor kinase 2-like [Cucumis melo var. makuwa]